MPYCILVVNAGSSSHKCKLFSADSPHPAPLWEGSLDWSLQEGQVEMHARSPHTPDIETLLPASIENPLQALLNTIPFAFDLRAVGHRVVHGGSIYRTPVLITPEVKNAIKTLIPLAPLHNPANLAGIEAMQRIFPDVPQIAVFDTSFHTTIPTYAAEYPIPQDWTNLGIRRYGFHGISHCYCAHRAAAMLNRNIADLNLISCHLGNGGSVTAVQGGCSIDTSMGFTPLEGIMMGTRSGSIDPGITLYLLREKKFALEEIEAALNHQSGLKAVGKGDGDMRQILQGVSLEDADCLLALEMYVYRLAKEIAAMAAALKRIDAIIFTAGIGENCPLVRAETCNRLIPLGICIDQGLNQAGRGDQDLTGEKSRAKVLVIQTKEEWAIAKACVDMLS